MTMNIAEASIKADSVVNDLLVSMKKEQVENIFTVNSIDDKQDRILLLRKCMNVLGTSNSNSVVSLDDEYNDELEIFLSGRWRFLL
ncbi:MAG: hypothetical protein LBH44_13515 [Treponema sp.]|jgi:dsDNA-binding SOS-regulon protein|nr:hypothetical protein [Treponema sp.]